MSKLTLTFANADDLRSQLNDIAETMLGVPPPGLAPPPTNGGEPNIALFTNEELKLELSLRERQETTASTPPAPAPDTAPTPSPKRGRGRPAKEKSTATVEAPPQAATIPPKPVEPDKRSTSVAPSLPTEDAVLGLMSEVYSQSGDRELVRGIMMDVGGKTQLSQIEVNLWPALVERLQAEMARLKKVTS